MIGLGVDLCEITRIQAAIERANGFLERYYTDEERAYITAKGNAGAQSAAAMYAAKEAFLKAIGTGLGGVPMHEIGVTHDERGAPRYVLMSLAQQQMRTLGASHAHLSLTHEADMACAVCLIE